MTAKVHGETKPSQRTNFNPAWGEDFFNLGGSTCWKDLTADQQKNVLTNLAQKIFQEAYFIECAGMAYAAKMNLASKSKEEREFFCFVAEEETKHLRMLEGISGFQATNETIPSFALLIGEIIQEAQRPSHLILIQILLEGWGLSYYKNLSKYSQDEEVTQVFKQILKDEIRHHSAGVLLFNQVKSSKSMTAADEQEFLTFLERLAFMVKVGPWNLCDEVFKFVSSPTKHSLKEFLLQVDAVKVTEEKLQILVQLLEKNLPDELWQKILVKKIFAPMDIETMTEALAPSISGTFQLAEDR